MIELAGKFRISREYIKWKSQAATISPGEFLSKAQPFGKAGPHGPAVEKYRAAIRAGEKIRAPQLYVSRVRAGDHAANFKVTGHEGRHRMTAAQQEGITKVPVEIVAYQEPRFHDRSKRLKKAMKMPRHFQPEVSVPWNEIKLSRRRAKTDIGSGVRLTRYNEFGIGMKTTVKPISIFKAKPLLKSVRRQIEKTSPQDKVAVRAVFGVYPKGRAPGATMAQPYGSPKAPRLVDVKGRASILHYRKATEQDSLRGPQYPMSVVAPEKTFREHIYSAPGKRVISTTTNKRYAVSMRSQGAHEGVYATPLRDLIRNQREKTTQAMVNSKFPFESEITQSHGKNLMGIRKYTATAIYRGDTPMPIRLRKEFAAGPRHPWLRGYGFTRIDRDRVEMSQPIGYEAGIPLTGRVPRDRWIKKIRDEDLDRRDANVLRAGLTGGTAGSLLARGKLPLKARIAIGAGSGVAGVLGIRQLTKGRRDPYGERQRGDKTAESIPALAGLGAAGYGAYKILRKKFKMSDARFEFAKKEKRQMNPYVMAGLSGAVSGAALGILPLLRRGVGLKTALRTSAGGAAAGGTIVGGGSLLGSAILGDPDKKEGAAFTKRAAVGGAIVGGTLGVAGGLVARRVPVVRKQVGKLSREWRPAQWIKNSGPVKAGAIGGVAGGAYGAATGADEGQQVDSIRNIRKDLKRMHGFEFGDKDWRDSRRESRSEAAKDYMTGAGVLTAGSGVGAGVGYAGLRGGKAMNQVAATAKEASKATRSARVVGAKINRASTWIKRQITTFPTFRKLRIRLEAPTAALEFEKPFSGYNKKRHAKTGGLNDSFRKQYNREHGSNLKRPVTTEPSKLKPGSKAAKRRASFCARMGGMQGATSKEGKLTPKGAALKRWNCSAKQELIELNQRKKEDGAFGNTGRAAAALGLGVTANTAAATAAISTIQRGRAGLSALSGSRAFYSKKSGASGILRAIPKLPDLPKTSATLDRFARRSGYEVVDYPTPAVSHRPRKFYRHRYDSAATRAHEAGHVAQRGKKVIGGTFGRKLYQPAAFAGTLAGAVSTNPSQDKKATAIAAAATAATVPVMASEIDASARGYKMMRRMGESRARSLGAFKGVPSYAAIAAMPAIGWGLRKRSQAKKAKAELASHKKLIEMNDRTYRPGSTAEIRSMRQTPAMKQLLKKENARGAMGRKLRTLMKVLPFEARHEFQTMAPPMAMNPVYDERDRLKRQLLVTGAVATPVAGVGYVGWRSLRNSAQAMQNEESRMKEGRRLRADRRGAMSVGGQTKAGKFGPRAAITREPLPVRKSMQPETVERNQATNKAIATGKRYEQEINNRYRAGSKMKLVHSRGERQKMRGALAILRSKYKFGRQDGSHQFDIFTRDAATGRAASFWDQVQGRKLTRKNPLTGAVEEAPITTSSFISAARRKADQYNRSRKRGMGLVRDVSEVSRGKKTKKREWEKSWFQNKVQTAAGAAALLGAGVVYRKGGLRSAPGWAKSFRRGTDTAISKAQTYRAKAEDRFGKMMGLSACLPLRNFETYYEPQGWDLRDARGNSARVFSPKAKKRMRRQAEWHEKKDAQRKLLVGAGLLGATATGAAGLLIGRRFPIRKAAAVKAQNIIKFPKKNAS